MTLVTVVSIDSRPSGYILRCFLKHFTYSFFACLLGGLVGEWLACWTQAQKGPGWNRSRDAVLGKLFTPIVTVHHTAKLVAALLKVAGVTASLAESNGSLPPGLWLTSPAGWLPRTRIFSGTLRSVIEYGLPFYRAMLCIRGTSHGPVTVSVCVCLSVSVTSRSSTKTAKHRITQTTPHDSPGILVFWCQRSPRNSTGVTPYEGAECRRGGSKSTTFD